MNLLIIRFLIYTNTNVAKCNIIVLEKDKNLPNKVLKVEIEIGV